MKNLYQDKVDGLIDNETFSNLLENYRNEKKNYEEKSKAILNDNGTEE